MPISRKPGETTAKCMKRAMDENTKKYPYKQALAISLSQCSLSKKDETDWDFYFSIIYRDKIKKETKDGYQYTCKHCGCVFDMTKVPEAGMGYVKCPRCKKVCIQEEE